jgi:hypothetical protein
VAVLVLAAVAGVLLVIYGADRVVKARARARWRREMTGRLVAAATRAERHQQHQEAAVEASKALTSVIPAINHPARSSDNS